MNMALRALVYLGCLAMLAVAQDASINITSTIVKPSKVEVAKASITLSHQLPSSLYSCLQDVCDQAWGRPRNCAEVQQNGATRNGVYTIYLSAHSSGTRVYCDLTTDGGRWTVFQRRKDGSVDFYRSAEIYELGFGDPNGEHWLGNAVIDALSAQGPQRLRVDMEDFEGGRRYAQYSQFGLSSAADGYRLMVSGYSGTAGDSLTVHNGLQFSTKDLDRDTHSGSCANLYKGGWWYGQCHSSNLNGRYLGGSHSSYADGVNWKDWKGYNYSLKTTEMKMRPY